MSYWIEGPNADNEKAKKGDWVLKLKIVKKLLGDFNGRVGKCYGGEFGENVAKQPFPYKKYFYSLKKHQLEISCYYSIV